MKMPSRERLDANLRDAVKTFWRTRGGQARRQRRRRQRDQGARGAVTGGAQMDGFVDILQTLLMRAGLKEDELFRRRGVPVLPGFFRPTKEWDLVAVREGQLVAAIEVKSQVGSFGNNFNNRAEEAIGNAVDVHTAFREGAFGSSPSPWLGYLVLLEDCAMSQRPVRVQEPHFSVFPEFIDASYAGRYEILCRKLVRERHYDATSLLLSPSEGGKKGEFSQPVAELSFERYARSMVAHVAEFCG